MYSQIVHFTGQNSLKEIRTFIDQYHTDTTVNCIDDGLNYYLEVVNNKTVNVIIVPIYSFVVIDAEDITLLGDKYEFQQKPILAEKEDSTDAKIAQLVTAIQRQGHIVREISVSRVSSKYLTTVGFKQVKGVDNVYISGQEYGVYLDEDVVTIAREY